MKRWVLALVALGGIGCGKAGGPTQAVPSTETSVAIAPPSTVAAFDVNRPEQCAACHQAVVAEWESSLHRRAHTSRDPIFAAVHEVRSAREGAELVAKNCANCHSPAGETPELADLGVTCSTCHQTKAVDSSMRGEGKMGFAAFVRTAPNEIVGPRGADIVAGAPHALAVAEAHVFDGSTLCLSCHEELKNKDGIAACSTGIEWREGRPKDDETCVDCHMPWVEGPSGVISQARTRHRSHAFIGPHAALADPAKDLAKGALGLEVIFEGEGVKVTLENKTRHAWPTGFPGRFAVVALVGYDAQGREVWRNFTDDPMKEHPEAVLNKVYLDGEGQPTLAPYAKTLARDSRLKTDETRVMRVVVPNEVVRVEARLVSRLVAPPLAKRLELGELAELAPRIVKKAEARR